MITPPMRSASKVGLLAPLRWKRLLFHTSRLLGQRDAKVYPNAARTLAQVRNESFSELWFTASFPVGSVSRNNGGGSPLVHIEDATGGQIPRNGHKPPDERTIKLGRTLRTLSPLLPNLLTTPLPQEILSPHISLHLFPSTHPHLPVVKGRMPYRAALWTAPVAWGCVPVVGNVKLEILSEKIVRSGFITAPTTTEQQPDGLGEEKLVVKWRTEPKKNGNGNHVTASAMSASSAAEDGGVNRGLSTLLGGNQPLLGKDSGADTFSGLFVFSFDSEGRIVNHTIEHADENDGYDKTSKVVTLTDWLLGKARWRSLRDDDPLPVPGLAYKVRVCREQDIRKHEELRRRQQGSP